MERPARILPAIVLSQFAGTSLWFAGNAILPDLQRQWGLGEGAVAALTAAVQLGFIVGTLAFAVLNLADRHSPRKLFLACALLGAGANALALALPPLELRYAALLALRFATGFFLAGIYPVGMKIAAGWYREGLGGALGFLVGALVVGTAFPHLLKGGGDALAWEGVIAGVSLLAAAGGAVMYLGVPDGPHLAPAAPLDLRAIGAIFSVRRLRASAMGYFGHMWELYTFWALLPLLLAAYASQRAVALDVPAWSFAVIAAGAIGCVAGGYASRRWGSAAVAATQLGASGLCCLASPLAFLLPAPAFLGFMLFWGVVVVGDSPQFSAITAAAAPRERMGSALTFVNCIGFGLTIPSIALATAWAAHLPAAWWLVPVAAGPAIGLWHFRSALRAAG